MYLKTRDIAKFGQLLLQKGNWKGKQLIPEEWLAMANSRQVSNGASPESDWNNGYGFQFWMNASEGFRGDGAFGQLCVVLPRANVSGAWQTPDVLNVSIVFEGRCQMLRLKVSFGEEITIEPSANVSFGPFDVPVIRGRGIK